jgi:hypothetical protein
VRRPLVSPTAGEETLPAAVDRIGYDREWSKDPTTVQRSECWERTPVLIRKV